MSEENDFETVWKFVDEGGWSGEALEALERLGAASAALREALLSAPPDSCSCLCELSCVCGAEERNAARAAALSSGAGRGFLAQRQGAESALRAALAENTANAERAERAEAERNAMREALERLEQAHSALLAGLADVEAKYRELNLHHGVCADEADIRAEERERLARQFEHSGRSQWTSAEVATTLRAAPLSWDGANTGETQDAERKAGN